MNVLLTIEYNKRLKYLKICVFSENFNQFNCFLYMIVVIRG